MNKRKNIDKKDNEPKVNVFEVLKPYKGLVVLLVILAMVSNALNLVLPKLIARGIDNFGKENFDLKTMLIEFTVATILISAFTYLQSIFQTYASERVARDLRTRLSAKISCQSYAYIESVTPAKLLTNLTLDIDSIKTFVSQAIVSIVSSVFLIVGASILLLLINWKLALAVLAILPIITISFFAIFSRVRVFFKKSREAIDSLNKIINESVLGSALIRVLNSQQQEYQKFCDANTNAKNIGLSILRLFASLVPIITFVANIAILVIVALGGHFVISGSMTLGNFTAFNSYLAILIFPIIIIGFMSTIIAQASASYQRITAVLLSIEKVEAGTINIPLCGNISAHDISLSFGEKEVLKNISFEAKRGTKTAIVGPTAAGKTQLLNILTALVEPTTGTVRYDDQNIDSYDKIALYKQLGFVFQDSIIFQASMRENIAFSNTVPDDVLQKAISTAELDDFVNSLPQKLDTSISERGTSLSGGQKQRIMLARALALNPTILLLDDFTARVDAATEKKIVANVNKNYPNITLISVTQKISSVEHYDQIILLMEGEILARGTHTELMKTSPEYVQIYDSQRSTNQYELFAQ